MYSEKNITAGNFQKKYGLCLENGPWPNPTQAYLWPGVNKGVTQLWPGCFFTLTYNECDAERESVWKSDEDFANPIVTFPIKKRINTKLFIDGKHELYIHKRQIKNSWWDLL